MSDKKNIIILGAGFAGIYAAIHLSEKLKGEAEVLLVDANNYHLFKSMLHEAATGSVESYHITQPIQDIKRGRKFQFLQGMVQEIDLKKREIKVCEGCEDCIKKDECDPSEFGLEFRDVIKQKMKSLLYDYLIIAMGASPNYYGIKGAKEYSYPFNDLDDAIKLRNHISNAFRVANQLEDKELVKKILTFVVVGTGPTGIELISDLHDWVYHAMLAEFPRIKQGDVEIYLIEACRDVLPSSTPQVRVEAMKMLLNKKIKILTDSPVTEVRKDYISLKSGHKIDTFTTAWTAGVKGNDMLSKIDATLDKIGRIVVNEYLEVEGYRSVYAVGDCSCLKLPGMTAPLPQTGQVAVQEAECLVENIVREIKGKEKKPFRFRELGTAMSIGEHTALANILGVMRVGGLLGWILWKMVYLKHLIGIKRSFSATKEWFFDISYDREEARHRRAR